MRVYAKIGGRPYFLQKIPPSAFKGLQGSGYDFVALGYDHDTGMYTVVSPVELKVALRDAYTTNDDDLKSFTPGKDVPAPSRPSIPVFDATDFDDGNPDAEADTVDVDPPAVSRPSLEPRIVPPSDRKPDK